MARKTSARVDLEMESDEISLETTVPTDFSLSADDSELVPSDRRKRISKQMIDRKQHLHDLQVMKIELSQKHLIIDNMKAEHMQKTEELEEKLNEALHQKQISQARLESQLKIQTEEARRKQEFIQKEVEMILKKQQQLEATNERLQDKAGDIRKNLLDLDLTEKQFLDLRTKNVDDISLRDYVALRLYEAVRPYRLENEDVKAKLQGLHSELQKCRTQLKRCEEAYSEEKQNLSELQIQHQKLTLNLADARTQIHHGDYKIENYDKVKMERDQFEQELGDLMKKYGYLEVSHQAITKERDTLDAELSSTKQTVILLKQDKDFFAKQVSDLSNKLMYNEEKLIQLNDQLERAKLSREELYDKYVASRDTYKGEYENKLREEMEQIRVRTNTEIDRLKSSTREMYERENRSLREARDMALAERDRAATAEKDANNKYESLLTEFRKLQVSTDSKMSEVNNGAKIKHFEAERTQMLYEETVRNMKEVQLENEKLAKKLEVLTKEYYQMQNGLEKRVSEQESMLTEKNIKLETYEKLEQELDEVILQAADVDDEKEAEKVLFSYGYGANVPTTSKRRLKQSVHLARRVLALERTNTGQKKDIDKYAARIKELQEEINSANKMIDQSHQPYQYLVESIRSRDKQIITQKQHIASMEDDLKRLEKERSTLTRSKNQMATDLERLLNQKEEMSVLKQVVANLSQRRNFSQADGKKAALRSPPSSPKASRSKTAITQKAKPKNTFESQDWEENVHKPPPTSFTTAELPDWYKKVNGDKRNKLVTVIGK